MKPLEQSFSVTFNYSIYFTNGLFKTDNTIFKQVVEHNNLFGKKLLFIAEEGVLLAHASLTDEINQYITDALPDYDSCGGLMVIPGGEQVKNGDHLVKEILDRINQYGIDRQSFVIAIGGGAVLDMVGYAASIAHRGIRHIRVPTTVLSQNDSGIGVKNSINAFGKKNFLGNFTPPYAVINDFDFLVSLNHRDWRSGIAEAIKVALIKDAHFFDFIKEHAEDLNQRRMEPMQQLIHRCAEMHMNHIGKAGDPFEAGSSRPLDFGHWAAHKLEQLTNYSLRHGEAVAIGIALDSTYSFLSNRITEDEWKQILSLIQAVGFAIYAPELSLVHESGTLMVVKGLNEFREHLGGTLTIMLLEKIGKGVEVHEMDHMLIAQSIDLLQQHQNKPFITVPLS